MISADSYSELVEVCKNYKRIIVAGPQRSGTTFTSRALAKSLNYQIVDEAETPDRFGSDCYVWQFACRVHLLHNTDDYDLVIWMKRKKEDVEKSEKRIEWEWFDFHRDEYVSVFGDKAMSFDNNYDMKHYFWNKVQKKSISSDFIEFQYENLSDAPGYLTADKRKGFSRKQTC